MKSTILVSALSIAAATGMAQAGEDKFYAAVNIGASSFDDGEIRGANVSGAARNIDIEYDSGSFFSAALGVIAAEGERGRLRFDVEAAFQENDVDRLFLNDVERSVRDGSEISATTVMVNAYADTPLFADRLRGFAGVGFGIANIDHEVRYLVERPEDAGGNLAIAIPSTETTYAYQFVVGAEAKLSNALSLTVDGRFIDYGDIQVERFVLTNGAIDSVLDSENGGTVVTGGIRYSF